MPTAISPKTKAQACHVGDAELSFGIVESSESKTADPPALGLAKWFADDVRPHEPLLRAWLRDRFPERIGFDDVVQESYLRIWRTRATRSIHSAKAFLFTVARHIALDLLRRERRSPVSAVGDLAALDVIAEEPSVAEAVVTAERVRLLAEALAELPPRARQVVMLCKIQGFTHREAARKLGITNKTVDEHMYRGLKRLGATLRKQGFDCLDGR